MIPMLPTTITNLLGVNSRHKNIVPVKSAPVLFMPRSRVTLYAPQINAPSMPSGNGLVAE